MRSLASAQGQPTNAVVVPTNQPVMRLCPLEYIKDLDVSGLAAGQKLYNSLLLIGQNVKF